LEFLRVDLKVIAVAEDVTKTAELVEQRLTRQGRGGSPHRIVATGVRKMLNRESRERTRKEDEDF